MSVNLKTLSESLGLSETTVSRGLNGYSDVSESTRQRIIEAAQRLNYSPNVRAKSLATGKSMVVGFVIPKSNDQEIINPILGDVMAGASSVLADQGYSLLMVRVTDADEHKTYQRLYTTGAVDGLFLLGPLVQDERIPLLNMLGIPFIVHGRSSGIEEDYSWVDVNNRRCFLRATQFLIDLGHKDVALLNGPEHMEFAQRRRQGFLDAFDAAQLPVQPELLLHADMTEDYGYRETMRLLERPNPPSAFVTSSYIVALGTRRAIEERGFKLGKDISVITYDDEISYLPNGTHTPIFTCTRSSVSYAGQLLAHTLMNKIKGVSAAETQTLLEAELIVGQSTGPAQFR